MKKRLTSILLTLAMLLSLLPALGGTARAADTGTFAELQALIDAAGDGATVKLEKDYEATDDKKVISITSTNLPKGNTLTLDLNGHVIDGKGLAYSCINMGLDTSALTVIDSGHTVRYGKWDGDTYRINTTGGEGYHVITTTGGLITGGTNSIWSTGYSSGRVNIYGGAFAGNINKTGGYNTGVGVYGQITLYGGVVTGNASNGISAGEASLCMAGGASYDNKKGASGQIVIIAPDSGKTYSDFRYGTGALGDAPTVPVKADDYGERFWAYAQTWLASVHTVTWKDADGTVLKTDTLVPYGSAPGYNGATPTKAEDAHYTYEFAGWSPSPLMVTGDMTYTATYTATRKRQPITPAVTLAGWTYGETANEPSVSGGNPGNGAVTYEYKAAGAADGAYSTTVPTDAGTYTVRATVAQTDDYLSGTATANFTISPKTVTAPTIELSPAAPVYDGAAKTPTVTVKDGGTVIPASEYTVSYSNNTDVGEATVTITDKAGGNYTVSGSAAFSITRATPPLSVSISGWTYGETANTPTLTGNAENGAVTWEYKAAGAADSAYSTTVPTAAGNYTVRASVAETANYAAGTATKDFTIAKAALTVTAKPNTIVKGEAPAGGGVTYAGFVNGENESVLGGELAYAYSTDGNTAGSFTITPGGLSSGNYAISYAPGTLTVKDTYAVSYYRNYAADDEAVHETQTKIEDEALTLSLPDDAERTGYVFDGWFSARSGGTKREEASASYTDNAALSLYAHWTANRYTVEFDANGGSGEMEPMAFTYDAPQTLTANAFTRSAYHFVGWAAAPDGTVEWNNGAQVRNLTAEEDGAVTLYAIWTPKPVYRVSGHVVTSDHAPLSGVVVKLMRGNEEIASTVTAADGLYAFDAPVDTYNIVATWRKAADTEITKTQLVVLNGNKSYELAMPNGKTNSVLELKGDDTPPVVVGGLDQEAAAVKTAEGDDVADVKNITVTMTVESKDEDEIAAEDATAIRTAASGRTLDYLAISVEKTIDNEKSRMTTTRTVLEIVVPYDFTGKQTVEVYRYHGTDAEAMTALTAQPDSENPAADGAFWLDKENGLIYIYAKNFSTYAIGYTVPPKPTYAGETIAMAPFTYPPVISNTPHGGMTVSPAAPGKGDKVTLTLKPDNGFEAASVTVTGPDGETIPVTDNGDGTYSFIQPNGKAKIEAAFRARSLKPYSDCAGDASCPVSAFSDANPKAWYHDGVHWAIENGVMDGVGNGLFKPGGDASRAMVAVMLWRLEGKPAADAAPRFDDVEDGRWYSDAVNWAAGAGVITGWKGRFAPNDAVTREQLAAMLYRYAQYKGVDVSAGEDTNILSYNDAFDIAEYAIPAMQWACGSGIIDGMKDESGRFGLSPQRPASRAVVATMIMRHYEKAAQ